MGFENLTFEVRDGLACLTLNRPKAANAFNLDLAREFQETATICAEDPAIRAVLLTGAGRMFSAGGDLKDFSAAGDQIPKRVADTAGALHAAIVKFARMNAPIVAAVNGPAAGAGMSLVCMTDIALAAESASFMMAYTAAGLTPDGSSTYFLPRVVGIRRARELMLTNRKLSAAEAQAWGIVERVVPDADLMTEAEKLARTLASGPTLAFGATKKLLLASQTAELEDQLDAETSAIVSMTTTSDGHEGVTAFREKRRPNFKGA
ncbi:MAG: enoyl-CoA hydratase/isomerase family protein [Deltaproteobacteria bacterium]|nr:enoyl-CoA hydratase/isomerase family protein [Deltaproteobacteria bacterium]MBW2578074.1 enoyl-CoA hydratase/isomerase family protein [Deltaproteobacteria bacterium]MBW2693870.1 enoyl-CoA hydratase/isomerase family protein [Deltaproteobacteria bacterium]